MKKKTLPHLLYLGKWSSFIIRVPRGYIFLYYEGASNPLFEWKHPEPAKAFLPIYYYYNSEKGHAIGVAFDCASSIFYYPQNNYRKSSSYAAIWFTSFLFIKQRVIWNHEILSPFLTLMFIVLSYVARTQYKEKHEEIFKYIA